MDAQTPTAQEPTQETQDAGHESSKQNRPRRGVNPLAVEDSGKRCASSQNRLGSELTCRPWSAVELSQQPWFLAPSAAGRGRGRPSPAPVPNISACPSPRERREDGGDPGSPQLVAVVAVPSKQKCPAGHGCSARSLPVTSHTNPAGHSRGTYMPSPGQMYPMGHRTQASAPVRGPYVPRGHSVKLAFPLPGQYVPRGHAYDAVASPGGQNSPGGHGPRRLNGTRLRVKSTPLFATSTYRDRPAAVCCCFPPYTREKATLSAPAARGLAGGGKHATRLGDKNVPGTTVGPMRQRSALVFTNPDPDTNRGVVPVSREADGATLTTAASACTTNRRPESL